jgi:crotonobetainyl-CoA:carnitine CoA-transferase CaiB-like acyl-CoA transferase
LADAGARVIKIERPEGDFARGYDSVVHGLASYFVWINRGKESLVLDLKQAEEAALLHRILRTADVFIQNLAPEATERLGFGSAALREQYPQLITCDIMGYGDGPYRDMKAYDLLVQAESGLVSVTGAAEAYGRIGVSICDIGAGMNASAAILQALLLRERTGQASGVKVSLFDTAADWMSVPLAHHDYGGRAPQRVGLNHPSISPYGGYQTAEGETVVISIQNEREWARFCREILDRPDMVDDPRFNTNQARVVNRPAVNEVINAVFSGYTRPELTSKLRQSAIAHGAVNSVADLSQHPQLRRWPMETDQGVVSLIAPPLMTEHDDYYFRPVPAVGEHTEKIRAEFAAPQVGGKDDRVGSGPS